MSRLKNKPFEILAISLDDDRHELVSVIKGAKVPGIHICDLLPKSAAIMDKWSIIRSLHHGNNGHSAADQIMFTGYPPLKSNAEINVHPSIGSVIAKEQQHLDQHLPAYVMIPRLLPGAGPAYLGQKWSAFETVSDPAAKGKFKIPQFELSSGRM